MPCTSSISRGITLSFRRASSLLRSISEKEKKIPFFAVFVSIFQVLIQSLGIHLMAAIPCFAGPTLNDRQSLVGKGQLISKCIFGVFNFFQKMNKNTSHNSKNKLICSFFGRIEDTKGHFEIN